MKKVRFIMAIFITTSFFISCDENNKYYSPFIHKSISIDVPVSWDSIREWPTDEDVIVNKFIGESDMATGLDVHVYDVKDYDSTLLDTLIMEQLKMQLIKNTTTKILDKGKRTINNKVIGYIEYSIDKNNAKRFGKTILAISNKKAYILDIYSLTQKLEDFRIQCETIIKSVVFLNKNDPKD